MLLIGLSWQKSDNNVAPDALLHPSAVTRRKFEENIVPLVKNVDIVNRLWSTIRTEGRTAAVLSVPSAIIKHNATQRASAFAHTDTHIEGRGKKYYNIAGKE